MFLKLKKKTRLVMGFPSGISGREPICQCRRHKRCGFDPWVRMIPWRRDRLPTPASLGFPGGSAGKESYCNAGDQSSVPGLGKSPGGGHANPLEYSCLENPHGQRSLVGYSPCGCKESDTTELLALCHIINILWKDFIQKIFYLLFY